MRCPSLLSSEYQRNVFGCVIYITYIDKINPKGHLVKEYIKVFDWRFYILKSWHNLLMSNFHVES